jgi:hypothetical protein
VPAVIARQVQAGLLAQRDDHAAHIRRALLAADRTRDVRTITTVVTEVLAANPESPPLDIETALRAAAGQAHLVANSSTAGF